METVGSSVVDMLREDHQKVKKLFEEFEEARDARTKRRIVETALMELEIHAKLEEGLIYPAIREEIDDEELMDEALEEHHVVHLLIRELKKMSPSRERFDAKFKVLAESVKHHIEEEESQVLPKAKSSDIDFEALEQEVMKRKARLMGQSSGGSRTGRASSGKDKRSRSRSTAKN